MDIICQVTTKRATVNFYPIFCELNAALHKREHRGTRGEATEVEAAETPNLIQESRLSMASEIDSAVITEPPK